MILDALNDEQRDVVISNGNVLLTACPGSGKTRVIINKIAFELERLEPKTKRKILALTFTNRASDEITRRLNRLGALSPKIWSGTIHSFCMEWIIRPYSGYIDELKNGYSIADENFITQTINQLKQELNFNAFQSINLKFNRDGNYVTTEELEIELLDRYYQKLKDSRQIDFDSLLNYSNRLLTEYPRIAVSLSKIFKYILVDEFQDTQDIQYSIISKILQKNRGATNVMFVGDTDQAIYNSLGGLAKSFEELKQDILDPGMNQMTLSGNYRSHQRIIDFYRNFQTNNIEISALRDFVDQTATITLNTQISRDNISEEIARLIQRSIDLGISENEICVLVPQWWLVTSITRRLRNIMPHVNFDASGLTPMSSIRENVWYKLSRLFLSEPNPKIYSTRYKWASEVLESFRQHLNFDIVANLRPESTLLKITNEIISEESEGIDYLRDCFLKFLAKINIELEQNISLLESWESFFQSVQLRIDDENYDVPTDVASFKKFYKERGGVVINTCVGVKGEEFETVIAYGLLHGYIPHWNDIIPPQVDHISASKKLLYVICSRAKSNLHLIAETGRTTRRGDPLQINHQLVEIIFDYDTV